MTNGYIAVFDSGIGGISMLNELIRLMPNERFIYFGDNENAPYGNKSKRELFELAISGVERLNSFPIKALVLGCNTLSANLIGEIRGYSKVPTFGVFPPIERCVVNGERTLVLCTVQTREKIKNHYGVDVVGLKNLASEIERCAFCLNDVDFSKNLSLYSVGKFCDKKEYYDTIILGCTHYEFIKNKISDHFRPRKILSGNFFTAMKVKKYFENHKSLENNYQNSVIFIGENAGFNQNFFVLSGQIGSNP